MPELSSSKTTTTSGASSNQADRKCWNEVLIEKERNIFGELLEIQVKTSNMPLLCHEIITYSKNQSCVTQHVM